MLAELDMKNLLAAAAPVSTGRVTGLVGFKLDIEGIEAAIGDAVEILLDNNRSLEAEVVAIHGEKLSCLPFGEPHGVRFGSRVKHIGNGLKIQVGKGLLGRVLNGLGKPLDNKPIPSNLEEVNLQGPPPHPLLRSKLDTQIPLGIKALDTLVPCARGQRLGIFAGSGVGKSSLLSMIAKNSQASVAVIALIGERGREVAEFIEHDLGEKGLAKSVVVVSTSDEPALSRIRAAFTATRIAEWFRDQGEHVVLMMDSITRFAMAQREVGLSAGEPPATRGYPPSVFALLPKLLERAGAGEKGSITGFYTVLVEGDDMNEPIADTARSILDGHIVLSRRLASMGHFPAIEILDSISRLETSITSEQKRLASTEFRRLIASYADAKDLIEIGAYVQGTNPLVDRAIFLKDYMDSFLKQTKQESVSLEDSWQSIQALVTN